MRVLRLSLIISFFLGCTTDNSSKSATGGASWYETMHRLSVNHSALTPILADPKEFYDPKNLSFIREKTNEMMKASVEMTKDTTAPNADPIIAFTAEEFSNELKAASQSLDSAKLRPAHYTLSHLGNYCISCHSRADRGSKNFPLPWASNLSHLNSTQKITYYLANRQYETAHLETEKIIQNDSILLADPNMWMLSLQKDLAVMVRVQQDLPRAQKLVSLALSAKNLPAYLMVDMKAWLTSLKDWQMEDKQSVKSPKKLEFVKRLLDQARSPKYAQNQSGFMIYLRASGILHELLESSREGAGYSSALYFAGVTAEALKTVDVWKLGEHYLETCIENSPHSPVAIKCYAQLEHLALSSHPDIQLIPDMAERVKASLAKFKDLSQLQNASPKRPGSSNTGPRY